MLYQAKILQAEFSSHIQLFPISSAEVTKRLLPSCIYKSTAW